MDQFAVLVKLVDFGVAALALAALWVALQTLRRMVEQLEALRHSDEQQTAAIQELTNEVRHLRSPFTPATASPTGPHFRGTGREQVSQ